MNSTPQTPEPWLNSMRPAFMSGVHFFLWLWSVTWCHFPSLPTKRDTRPVRLAELLRGCVPGLLLPLTAVRAARQRRPSTAPTPRCSLPNPPSLHTTAFSCGESRRPGVWRSAACPRGDKGCLCSSGQSAGSRGLCCEGSPVLQLPWG